MNDQRHLGIVTGGANTKPEPPKIRTKDEALNYLEESVKLLLQKRKDCDVVIPDNMEMTVALQKKAERKLLVHVGKVMGEAAFAFCSGWIEQTQYERFHQAALNALAAKVVGIL